MSTLLDIAERAGVAKSTVSRALRGDQTLSIAESTRSKIFEVAKEVGYKTKQEKQAMIQHHIWIVHKDTHFLNQVDNAYYFSIRYGIETACRREKINYSFVPLSYFEPSSERIDGVIVIGNFTPDQMHAITTMAQKLPMVLLGKVDFMPGRMDWVTCEERHAVTMAMDCLKDCGHRTVLYIGGLDVEGTPKEHNKKHHYLEYIGNHPELRSAGEVEGEHGADSGYEMMEQWLAHNKKLPDAIFVSNDPLAIGAIRALRGKGIDVPSGVSVISINGDCTSAVTAPPLTTVDVHTELMGKETVDLLADQIRNKRKNPKKVMFYPELRLAGSVGRNKAAPMFTP